MTIFWATEFNDSKSYKWHSVTTNSERRKELNRVRASLSPITDVSGMLLPAKLGEIIGFQDVEDAMKFCELLAEANPSRNFRMVQIETTVRYLKILPLVKKELNPKETNK